MGTFFEGKRSFLVCTFLLFIHEETLLMCTSAALETESHTVLVLGIFEFTLCTLLPV